MDRWKSATFLALLACQAQCGTREGHRPTLADRVAAGLADAVGAVGDPGQGPIDLGKLLALVVDNRELLVALEAGGAHVCLVVPGAVTGVAHQPGELFFLRGEGADHPGAVVVQVGEDLIDLGLGPGLLTGQDREARWRGRLRRSLP